MIIESLSDANDIKEFDCGVNALNIFITKNALNYQKAFASKTYLLKSNKKICGFYSISATIIEQNQVDIRWPKHPLPAVLLGRLAVDKNYQGQGLGAVLFADACKKTISIAETIGCVGLITDAKDHNAIKFYTRFGMLPFKNKSDTLFIKTKTIINLLNKT
jgi:GNAT superfamily N-acetyltransferase